MNHANVNSIKHYFYDRPGGTNTFRQDHETTNEKSI
jgi:hypothetical protein